VGNSVLDKRKVGEEVKGVIFLRKKTVKINYDVYTKYVLEMLCEITIRTIFDFVSGVLFILLVSSESCINPKGINVLSEAKEKKGKGCLPTLLKSQNTSYKQFQSMASFSSLWWVEYDVLGLAINAKKFWYMCFPFLSQGQVHVQCTHFDSRAP